MTPERLKSLAELLEQIGSPAMVIGGLAVAVHGLPRLTRDADVTLGLETSELEHVIAAAAARGFEPRTENPWEFVAETRVLPLRRSADGWEVDLIFAGSPYEMDAIGRSRVHEIEGVRLPVVSAEDLLIHKIVAGRPRDIEDARSIVERQGDRLDHETVRSFFESLAATTAEDDLVRRAEELLSRDD